MLPKAYESSISSRPIVGISSCLLGESVRYDGGHKWSAFCAERIAPFVSFQPICPESAIGLPTPRPPIDLVQTAESMEAWSKQTPPRQMDAALRALADRIAQEYELDGYILMQRSPSCALSSAKVYASDGTPLHQRGSGIFAARLRQLRPEILLVEEQALQDEAIAFAFLCGIHIRHAWRRQGDEEPISFHQEYGYLLEGLGAPFIQQVQQLERWAYGTADSARPSYHQELHTLLQEWLAAPLDIREWLRNLRFWLRQRFGYQDQLTSLADLADLLESHRSRSISDSGSQPRPLPFFRTFGI